MWGVLIFHIANIAILCYICVNGVLNVEVMYRVGWNFWKNGGNFWREEWKRAFFCKRVSPPHRAEQSRAVRADNGMNVWRKSRMNEEQKERFAEWILESKSRAEQRAEWAESRRPEQSRAAHDKNQKDPHRYIYFPLETISIVRYRPNQISIQK